MKPTCKRCGRLLKNPESVKYSMGPVCLAKELGIEPRTRHKKDPNYPKIIKDDEYAEYAGESNTSELPKS